MWCVGAEVLCASWHGPYPAPHGPVTSLKCHGLGRGCTVSCCQGWHLEGTNFQRHHVLGQGARWSQDTAMRNGFKQEGDRFCLDVQGNCSMWGW